MGRPRAKDGVQLVHFEEYPGHWIASPERDREKALRWARRNRERLINRKTHDMAFYCAGFFNPSSPWIVRMRKKGRHYTDKYLLNRQGYVNNYIIPEFGGSRPGLRTRPGRPTGCGTASEPVALRPCTDPPG
jgi:hypothetical protein